MSLKFFSKNSGPVAPPTNLGEKWESVIRYAGINDAVSTGTNIIAVGSGGAVCWSDKTANTWAYVSTPTTNTLRSIVYNGSVYVAVGDNGTIITSVDFLSWNSSTSGTTNQLNDIIWNGSFFVAVGNTGTILTSPDAITWTTRTAFSSNNIVQVVFSGSVYVAITSAIGVIGRSEDAINWTAITTGVPYYTDSIVYGNGIFVTTSSQKYVASPPAQGAISTSTDGITWTSKQLQSTGHKIVIFTGTKFIVFHNSTTFGSHYSSTNGIDWQGFFTSGLDKGYGDYVNIIFTSSFYLTLHGRPNMYKITESAGVTSMAAVPVPKIGAFTCMAWNGKLFVASNGRELYSSPDLVTWTFRHTSYIGPGYYAALFTDIVWTGSIFVAVGPTGGGGYAGLRRSSDGITWQYPATNSFINFYSVAWSGNIFVQVGGGGAILTSLDGSSWTSRTSGTTQTLNRVIWAGNQFIACGSAGVILTSPDGIIWTTRTTGLPSTAILGAVSWSGSVYVAVGTTGNAGLSLIITSSDSINWTVRSHPETRTFYDVVWANNRFVVVGNDTSPTATDAVRITHLVLTSSDGISWTSVPDIGNSIPGGRLLVTPTKLIAVGYNNKISVSPPMAYSTI
jgi:hypothetical protein